MMPLIVSGHVRLGSTNARLKHRAAREHPIDGITDVARRAAGQREWPRINLVSVQPVLILQCIVRNVSAVSAGGSGGAMAVLA